MTLGHFTDAQRRQYTDQQQALVSLVLRSAPLGSGAGADVRNYTLPVNPSSISVDRPSRQSVTQTLGGAYQDHWGEGLISVGLSGNTGWRPRRGLSGYESIVALRDILHEYDRRCANTGRPADVFLYLLMDLPAGWERFRVSKNSARYDRTKNQPLLYLYDLSFTVLEDLSYIERIDASPIFIISSYPLKTPPPVAATGGNGGNGVTGGTVTGGGVVTGSVTGVYNGGIAKVGLYVGDTAGPYLDPGVVENLTNATTDAAIVAGSTSLNSEYFYITADTVPVIAKTIRDLAGWWYSVRGWTYKPGALWPLVRDANPDVWSSSAEGETLIPVFDRTDESWRARPTRIRMPYLDPAPWKGDADLYGFNYRLRLQNIAVGKTVETVKTVLWNGLTDTVSEWWDQLSGAVTTVSDAIGEAWAQGEAQTGTLEDALNQKKTEPLIPPPMSRQGPS